ncbi:MAG: ribosome maturation factor RimP [Candidatus Palauibacterales bacterium]|nr:ribosome maturation factor RimP [Candidatus Palauibacterales bacterium]MDP2482099.1 ribosome maturation factor RimP [Candidatus Palauibacterales bacterium]
MARLEPELERFLSGMGFELVSAERGGGRRRPLLRLRVDRPDSRPGHSNVTVDDCAEVSRAVSRFLEQRAGGEEDWVLEVSSPGVDRPLTKPRDYVRFAGQTVRLRGFGPLLPGSRQVVGRLVGLEGEPGGEAVVLDVAGEKVTVPLADIAGATLVYDFAGES